MRLSDNAAHSFPTSFWDGIQCANPARWVVGFRNELMRCTTFPAVALKGVVEVGESPSVPRSLANCLSLFPMGIRINIRSHWYGQGRERRG